MNKFLQIEKIVFGKNSQALCALPNDMQELEQSVAQMGLVDHPVIVLIGGHILHEYEGVTLQAIEVITKIAEILNAALICGGTDVGVMAAIGKARSQGGYQFPLIGIAPEGVVTWPQGPESPAPFLPGNESVRLEPHHSHFILIPSNQFGDESRWIVRTATMIAMGRNKSVTILVNGGKVSQQDVEQGLAAGHTLLVLSGTGRLADEIAALPPRNRLIRVVSADNKRLLAETLRAILK